VFAARSVSTPQSSMWADPSSCDTVSVNRVRRMFCVNATMRCVGSFNKLRHSVCHSCSPQVLCQRHNALCGLIQQAATRCLSFVFAACCVSTPQTAILADQQAATQCLSTSFAECCVNATMRCVG